VIAWAWAVRNCRQVGPARRGTASTPAACRISPHRRGGDWIPETSQFWILLCPQVGSSGAIRRISVLTGGRVLGRLGRRRSVYVHLRHPTVAGRGPGGATPDSPDAAPTVPRLWTHQNERAQQEAEQSRITRYTATATPRHNPNPVPQKNPSSSMKLDFRAGHPRCALSAHLQCWH
jgi:hypothetical protein